MYLYCKSEYYIPDAIFQWSAHKYIEFYKIGEKIDGNYCLLSDNDKEAHILQNLHNNFYTIYPKYETQNYSI